MHDFTPEQYQLLTEALYASDIRYTLMHDVDARPEYSLRIARMEADAGIKATYYFRSMHFESHRETIRAIVALGHEAGYHYECLTTCNGDIDKAYGDFLHNLEKLRKIAPVHTACAHGSPRSPWNNQEMWESKGQRVEESKGRRVKETESQRVYDIHALGIEYEPLLDTDFSRTLYLTDTGRRWDGHRVSIRDKVPQHQKEWEREGLTFHTTDDITHAINDLQHPIHQKALLLNTHPQRWMPFGAQWLAEAGIQWWKNNAKRLIVWYMDDRNM